MSVSRHEQAKRYMEKERLLGVKDIYISLLDEDRVRLDKVIDNGKKSIKIPSFITDCKVEVDRNGDVLYGPFSGCVYEDIELDCELLDIQGLFSLMESDRLNIRFKKDVRVNNCKGLFRCSKRVKSIEIRGVDTSKVIDMSKLFEGCNMLKSIDLNWLDMSSAQNLTHMFCGCSSLKEVIIKNGGCRAMYMTGMFDGCHLLEHIDISSIKLSNVEYMTELFKDCMVVSRVDIDICSVSNRLRSIARIVDGCCKLEKLDLSVICDVGSKVLNELVNIDTGLWNIKELDLHNINIMDFDRYDECALMIFKSSKVRLSRSLKEFIEKHISKVYNIEYIEDKDGIYIMDTSVIRIN